MAASQADLMATQDSHNKSRSWPCGITMINPVDRHHRVPRLKVPDAAAAAAAAAAARGGPGAVGGSGEGAKLISSTVKTAQNLEFGAVTTQQLAGADATALRRRLAGGTS